MSRFKEGSFRQVGARKYRSWKEWSEGDYIIAKFVKTYEDKFKKECYEIQVIESSFAEHEDFAEGVTVGLNNCGSLAFGMQNIELGATFKVEYDSVGVIEKGDFEGKEFHKVNVYALEEEMDVSKIKEVQDSLKANQSTTSEATEDYDL